ncbi:hypothetical protein D3C87_439840 [compost metagenome]
MILIGYSSKQEIMEINNTTGKAHLQQFLTEFQPAKFKWLSRGIEVRGIVDIHRALEEARQLINRLQLELNINHTADMLSYRGFEVVFVPAATPSDLV